MKTSATVLSLLLGTSYALPLITTAYNNNLKCSQCVQSGNLFCTKKTGTTTVRAFTKLAAGQDYPTYATDQTAQYTCCQNASCNSFFGANPAANPLASDFECTGTDLNTAITSCPYVVDKCSAT